MHLYHGTAERHLQKILKDGIKPRGKATGNWRHTITSNDKAVYLTNAYALYFAMNATSGSERDDRLVVLEIDTNRLNPLLLAPDEDWLEQATRGKEGANMAPKDKSMHYRTRWYRRRLVAYTMHWLDSLKGMGNCTYHGVIPPKAITRIALIEQKTNAKLVVQVGIDPMITIMNYHIVGGKYRDSIKRLFGEATEDNDNFKALLTEEEHAERKRLIDEVWSEVEVRVNK